MKRILIAVLLVFISPLLVAETYTLDNQHSYVMWRVNHLGFSTQTGKWYVQGTLELDKDNPKNSKVTATIDINKLVTGIPELDKHLKSKLFFDAQQFPTATFVSNKVELVDKTTAKLEGTLTLKGVSKPVTLDVKFNKEGKNPVTDRASVGFSATSQLKRSEFGLNAFLPNVGDEVIIDIEVEAFQSNAKDTNAVKK